jgi:hypothetical protein
MGRPKLSEAHGNRTGYESGCRCDDCCEANRKYQAAWARTSRKKAEKPEKARRTKPDYREQGENPQTIRRVDRSTEKFQRIMAEAG